MGIWYSPDDPTPRETCPCCDYVTLPERGNYLICPVCRWEDDGLGFDQLDQPSGPNHMTLRDGRANFARFGACAEELLEHVCSPEERARFERQSRTDG